MFMNDREGKGPDLGGIMSDAPDQASGSGGAGGRDAMVRNLARQRALEQQRRQSAAASGTARRTAMDDSDSSDGGWGFDDSDNEKDTSVHGTPIQASLSRGAVPISPDNVPKPPVNSSLARGLRVSRSAAPVGDAQGLTSPVKSEPPVGVAAHKLQQRGLDDVVDPASPATPDVARAIPLDFSDLNKFTTAVPPPNRIVQCLIKRTKSGITRMFPTYELYSDEGGGEFLLAARKRKKNKSSNYIICTDRDQLKKDSDKHVGKVRSNFVGTTFSVYSNGINPSKAGKGTSEGNSAVRHELGAVRYDTNVLGRGPRVMKVVIPKQGVDGKLMTQPDNGENGMLERMEAGNMESIISLMNKPPKWSQSLKAYCLNFSGRVTEASVKNFQLVDENDMDTVLLQFGKTGDHEFTMDYRSPLTAVQAFGIVLTSFDNKLACE